VGYKFEVLFHGVNIKPGQWVMVSKLTDQISGREKFLVSLPGFPYSSFVTFLLYVVPIAEALEGRKATMGITGRLVHRFEKRFKKYQFVAVNVTYKNGEFLVDTYGKKSGSSGILTNLINCPGLMELPEGLYTLEAGTEVKLLLHTFPLPTS
jgi:molybdopterin molybdotransferase